MKTVAFFGGKKVGAAVLKELLSSSNIEVVSLVSNKADLSTDPKDSWFEKIHPLAKTRGIPYSTSFSAPSIPSNTDVVISAYYDKILPKSILSLPAFGAYNVHLGDIRKYRGAFPTVWPVLRGDDFYGVSIHEMDSQIDHGRLVAFAEREFPCWYTGRDLYDDAVETATQLFKKLLPVLEFANSKQDICLLDTLPADHEKRGNLYFRSDFPGHYLDKADSNLIRHVQALTSPPFPQPFVKLGNRFYTVKLSYDQENGNHNDRHNSI